MKFKHIPLYKIRIAENVRSASEDELVGLMESIEQHDVIQPVLVVPRGDTYELVSGHRRYAAMKARNEPTIPCIIRDDLTESDVPFIQLVENVQRKQLSPRELVTAFDAMLLSTPGLTKKKLAHLLGKSDAWVYDKYKAARIYDELVEAGLDAETIHDLSESDLKKLSHVKNKTERKKVARETAKNPPQKNQIIQQATSYEIERRGGYKDMSGGFCVYYSAHNKLMVICDSEAIQDDVVKTLLELKLCRIKADRPAS